MEIKHTKAHIFLQNHSIWGTDGLSVRCLTEGEAGAKFCLEIWGGEFQEGKKWMF